MKNFKKQYLILSVKISNLLSSKNLLKEIKQNSQGWTTFEYIAGAIVIVTIVGVVVKQLQAKLEGGIDQIKFPE